MKKVWILSIVGIFLFSGMVFSVTVDDPTGNTVKITSYSNVGIRTTNPQATLDVNGTLRIGYGWRGLQIAGSGTTPHEYQIILGDLGGNTNCSGGFGIYDNTEELYRFAISKTGNIGIGKIRPEEKLDIDGNAKFNAGIINGAISNWPSSDDYATRIFRTGSGGSGYPFTEAGNLVLQSRDTGMARDIVFATGVPTSISMVVRRDGSVGIGTASPDQMLTVNGNIHAKKVIVNTTGFSDFVFRPDYKLKPLPEVEKYIKSSGHLPDMPSEKEAVKKGVDVGEMQVKLLAKIEELTLHQIELDKKLAEQSRKLAEQGKKLAKLEAENTGLKKEMGKK